MIYLLVISNIILGGLAGYDLAGGKFKRAIIEIGLVVLNFVVMFK
jgi:hypothetical protein